MEMKDVPWQRTFTEDNKTLQIYAKIKIKINTYQLSLQPKFHSN